MAKRIILADLAWNNLQNNRVTATKCNLTVIHASNGEILQKTLSNTLW